MLLMITRTIIIYNLGTSFYIIYILRIQAHLLIISKIIYHWDKHRTLSSGSIESQPMPQDQPWASCRRESRGQLGRCRCHCGEWFRCIYLSLYLSVYLSIYLSIYIYIYLSIYIYLYIYIYLSIYLYIHKNNIDIKIVIY